MKHKVLVTGCILVLILILWIIWGNTALELNTYAVSNRKIPDEFHGFRIAHISDLHNAEIGKNNRRLISMLKKANPDIIVITGDLMDAHRTNERIALEFLRQSLEIAPCYYVPGNHECRIGGFDQFRSRLEAMGIIIPIDTSVELLRSGASITLSGLLDLNFYQAASDLQPLQVMQQELQELHLQEKCFNILLAHRPELFNTYLNEPVDLVFSGHAHGGQFRLPFVGGLYAPGQGFLPEYDSGLYEIDDSVLCVSRGIGNSSFPFRINNRPEVILIELQSNSGS